MDSYTEDDVRRAVDALWAKAAPQGHVYDESESIGIVAKIVLDAVAKQIAERSVIEYESRNECMGGNPYNNRFAWHTPGECSG